MQQDYTIFMGAEISLHLFLEPISFLVVAAPIHALNDDMVQGTYCKQNIHEVFSYL